MRTLTLRRTAVAAVLPLALGSLAACGSNNDSSATAGDPGAAASSSPTDKAAAEPQAGSTVSSTDFLALMKTAAQKNTTDKVAMTIDTSGGQSVTMKGEMDLTGDKPAVQMNMDMSSAGLDQVEMRLVDGVMYMNMGQLTQGKFVKFDLSDPKSPLGSLSSSLDNLDPAQMVGQLHANAFRHVTYVGSDAAGRHYKATLVSKNSAMVKGLPASALASLPKTIAYDVWLDSEGRFAKFQVLLPKTSRMTATYSDYGIDLHITAPDPSQVTNVPLGGSLG
jgi:hypothetical protein